MITKQLIAFIREQKSAGKTKAQITGLLSQNGWKEEDIAAGFRQVESGASAPIPQNNPDQLMGVIDLVKASWNLFIKRWQTYFGIMAFQILASAAIFILMLVGGLTTLFTSGIGSSAVNNESFDIGGSILLFAICLIAILAISLFSYLGYIAMYHVVRSDSEVGVKQAYSFAWLKFGSFLWVYILTMLVVMGGMMLLYVPGIIASIAISFSLIVLLTEDTKGYSALVRSWQYVYGHWWAVFWRFLAFGFLLGLAGGVLGAISMGILSSLISIIVAPIMAAYTYLLFMNLKSLPRDPQVFSKPNGHYKVYAVLGILMGLGYIGFFIWLIGTTPS
ncbi:MAG: hypothetical protein WC734_02305 [Patescibacteria group bacterium]|jgi:hypothetical protein